MSEKGQQGMPMHYNADDATYYPASEPGQNEKCLNAKYLKYGLPVLIIFVVLDLFAFTYYCTQRISEMQDEINALKRECHFDKSKRNGAAKEHDIEKNKNNSLRPFIEEFERIRERVQKLQPNKTTNTTKAFQDIKDYLNFLISSFGRNLSADGSHVFRLRFELNAKNEQTKAEPNIDELWERWNRTNAVVEDLTKLLTKQNETFHFKISYHSDVLYSEVKDVKLKQTKFQNETNNFLKSLRNQLNTTRQNLEQRLDDKISRANKSWHQALEDSVKSARSSIEDINVKADGMKEELQKSIEAIDNMKQQQNNLSKTKTEFQETHRKHDFEISDQVSKTDRLEDRIAKLESDTSQKNKIQHVELKQTKFHNETNKILNELRNQLNTARQNLEQRLDDKISRAHRPLEDSVKSARSFVEKINVKADGMKQDLQKSIHNIKQQQSEFKKDLSKTKTEFREKQRKHDSEISDQVSKTDRLEDRIAKLESDTSQKNKIQHLENRVKEIENGVSGLSRTDIKRYIFVLFLGWLMYDLLN